MLLHIDAKVFTECSASHQGKKYPNNTWLPVKHEMLARYWLIIGPASQALDQQQAILGLTFLV